MFMVIGKKEASRMIISFGVSPRPNQRISREIIAIGGAFRKKFPIKRKYSATPGAYALMTAHRNASVKEIVNRQYSPEADHDGCRNLSFFYHGKEGREDFCRRWQQIAVPHLQPGRQPPQEEDCGDNIPGFQFMMNVFQRVSPSFPSRYLRELAGQIREQ